jgi:hypothetical protein
MGEGIQVTQVQMGDPPPHSHPEDNNRPLTGLEEERDCWLKSVLSSTTKQVTLAGCIASASSPGAQGHPFQAPRSQQRRGAGRSLLGLWGPGL